MRWTRQRRRALESQGGLRSVSDQAARRRTAPKPGEAFWRRRVAAYGKTVWSWHPLLVSNRGRHVDPTGCRHVANLPTTVTRRIRRRGERAISRKTIAQGMPECSDCTCMLVCASHTISCTRDRGCSKHPAFPAPSCLGETVGKARAKCAAGMRRCALSPSLRAQRSNPPLHAGIDGLLRRFAPLRKRFAFVAGNDGVTGGGARRGDWPRNDSQTHPR
jgi:hypothetical protein